MADTIREIFFEKASLAKIKIFKGNCSKNKVGANFHPCNSFVGGGVKCPLMPFFMGGQMSGRASVRIPKYSELVL